MHWNGSKWADVATPNVTKGTNRLEAVLALSPNNAWAVGFFTPANADREPRRTLILHWDGKTWKVVPSPNVGTNSNPLSGLTANSANDIWAFGCHFAAEWIRPIQDPGLALGREELESCSQSQPHQGQFRG